MSLPENPISALLTMRETRDTLGVFHVAGMFAGLIVLGLATIPLGLPATALAGEDAGLQNVLALTALSGLPYCAVAALGFRLVALRDLSNEGLDSLGLPTWLVPLSSEVP